MRCLLGIDALDAGVFCAAQVSRTPLGSALPSRCLLLPPLHPLLRGTLKSHTDLCGYILSRWVLCGDLLCADVLLGGLLFYDVSEDPQTS